MLWSDSGLTNVVSQVLSKTVADAFAYFGNPSTVETQKFVAIFDKFFDCMNVRSRDLWIRKLKPDLKPYTSVDDPRFKVGDTYTGCVTIS